MQLVHYPKIPTVSEFLMKRFHSHPRTKLNDWCVTEFIDGDHLALYGDFKNKEFKMATRNKFITPDMNYSAAGEMGLLYKDLAMNMSSKEQTPVVVFGKCVGGHYNGKQAGIPIKTVCEYTQFNELIIHDIYLPKGGFIGLDILENIAELQFLKTAPIIYQGNYAAACGFPENSLSAVPFTSGEKVLFDNEMKGIVIRPIYDLTSGKDRVIMKKLNRKYIGKQDKRKDPELTDTLVEIAAYIDNQGQQLHVLDAVIAAYGTYGYSEIKRVSGRYVTSLLDKVTYLKYNMLDKAGKHLVHKELNRIAEDRLLHLLRMGSAA